MAGHQSPYCGASKNEIISFSGRFGAGPFGAGRKMFQSNRPPPYGRRQSALFVHEGNGPGACMFT